MRSEQQMMELIVHVAQQYEHVRAVAMNGSRVNPAATRDSFQDYDVVYIVDEMQFFMDNHDWVDVFGERIIMQMPELGTLVPPANNGSFMYLMLFADGNRIDLRLLPMEQRYDYVQEDTLTRIVLDKDGIMPTIPAPTDASHRIQLPTAQHFADCCNEFWWVSTYIAKGLRRGELLYALDHLNRYVRPMLELLLSWQVASEHPEGINVGKSGKYLHKYLPSATYQRLLDTYPRAETAHIWSAVWIMTSLFHETAQQLAQTMTLDYNVHEAERVLAYLASVYHLPADH
ncbi:aminoglycoside 6-adenylyltransferase [Paenibacillus sp. WLX1005]|uniref:aminoglycoside 6-adenylyltransferase n=1 Tax=Paenibacillus sp. WLX1005 TaxID=3243766 RepID=UPI003983DE50